MLDLLSVKAGALEEWMEALTQMSDSLSADRRSRREESGDVTYIDITYI